MRLIVKYTGPSQHTRRISKKQFKDAGIIADEDMEWSARNRHTVILDSDDVDESLVEYFTTGDPDFSVREVANKAAEKVAKELEEAEAEAEEAEGQDTTGTDALGNSPAAPAAATSATSPTGSATGR